MPPERLNILVADDQPLVVDMLSEIIGKAGHGIRTAENGAAALKLFLAEPAIDLIVSDMDMPVLDGIGLIRAVRSRQRDVPIIILTANGKISVAVNAMKCGANDYLLKDENMKETLLLSIDRVMEHHRLKMQNIRLLADLEQKNRELERMAFLDGLTGIANRRYFDKHFASEWDRAARDARPLALIMADIDFFKRYNDTYDHLGGDECLRKVAGVISGALRRPADFAARYGGEEFAVVMPGTELSGALTIARMIEEGMRKANIPHTGSEIAGRVTLSMGVGASVPKPRSSFRELIAQVDHALYRAKQGGRGRFVTAEEGAARTEQQA